MTNCCLDFAHMYIGYIYIYIRKERKIKGFNIREIKLWPRLNNWQTGGPM